MVERPHDADAATLRRGLADPPGTRIGVDRAPPQWVGRVVDEARPALGLPPALRDALDERREAFAIRGLCAAGAHEAAWDAVDAAERYRAHLDDGDARDALDALAARLRAGETLTLVSTEAVPDGPSHRTILRERLAERVG